ncbi:MAG TPA: UDP-N-acetylmuramoyl-L-alanine--D-glutamate ligase [Candidatus Polarisedimenticolia bacterium]|nr:UDP-N-acetylmuramoyl-L-alanine--D-glutamate ligase [Candidatus Polarisedimenticolia bacterium]
MTSQAVGWKRVGVMGLGLSGCASARFLARRGVQVTAADSKERSGIAEAAELESLGVRLVLGADAGREQVFAQCEAVVASPGVPPGVPALAGAAAAGVPVLAEVELAFRWLRGVLIGITGSNGKSTVTELTGRILRQAGLPTRVCGNIGTPLIEVVEQDQALAVAEASRVHYVVELSSFQLEGIRTLAPRVAVLLNLSPDHQDRYASPGDYFAAKARLFMNQRGDDIAIINWDDPPSLRLAERLAARLFPFSLSHDLEDGAVLCEGNLVLRRLGRDESILPASEVPLRGRHNLENVLAAAAAAAHCGASAQAAAQAIRSFRGLSHRLEFVADVSGVAYYNDSKATNVGATLRAVEAFHEPLVLLLGGYDKGGEFEELRGPLSAGSGRVRAVITFGQAGEDIAARLQGAAPGLVRAGSLADAVKAAATCARGGDVVLLAPACASFDAYSGYAERGEDFRRIVQAMAPSRGGRG